MTKHSSPISSVASSKNYIATAGYDNQVILWEKHSKEFINRGCHDHLANYVSFSPCEKYLLSTSSDYTARVWSVPDMKLLTVFTDHKDDVENAAFSTDGKFIATASRDHVVRIFTINGALVKELLGHTADVLSVVWTNNDEEIISSGDDGTIRVWNIKEGMLKSTFSFDDVETDTCEAFGNYIYAGNDNGEINIMDTNQGKLLFSIPAHQVGIKSLKINKQLKLLISSSYDKTVKLWSVIPEDGTLQLLKTISCPSSIWLRAVNIVDTEILAFGTFGSSYALYNTAKDEWDFKNVLDTPGKNAVLAHNKDVYAVGDAGQIFVNEQPQVKINSLCNFFTEVKDIVVTGGQTGELFDAKTGKIIHQHHSPLNCGCAYQNNGNTYLVVGSYTGEALIFKYDNAGLSFIENVKLHSNAIKGIACNGKLIFSVCANRDAAFHDAGSFQVVKQIKHAHDLIANGADWISGDAFVSISRDRKLRIWNSYLDCKVIPTPHTHSIKCVKVSALNSALIATGSYNGKLCIYDMEKKEWIYNKKISPSGISSLGFSKETNAFLASSYDSNIYTIAL